MTCTPNPGQRAALSFTNNNQIVGDTYDGDGNMLTDGTNTFTYDAEGRGSHGTLFVPWVLLQEESPTAHPPCRGYQPTGGG